MPTEEEATETPTLEANDDGRHPLRRARWIGIALLLVLGGVVAALAGALPDSPIGWAVAVGVLGFIVLLVGARFVPDRALGGRVGRARARAR